MSSIDFWHTTGSSSRSTAASGGRSRHGRSPRRRRSPRGGRRATDSPDHVPRPSSSCSSQAVRSICPAPTGTHHKRSIGHRCISDSTTIGRRGCTSCSVMCSSSSSPTLPGPVRYSQRSPVGSRTMISRRSRKRSSASSAARRAIGFWIGSKQAASRFARTSTAYQKRCLRDDQWESRSDSATKTCRSTATDRPGPSFASSRTAPPRSMYMTCWPLDLFTVFPALELLQDHGLVAALAPEAPAGAIPLSALARACEPLIRSRIEQVYRSIL
jgi:hypothetical protein